MSEILLVNPRRRRRRKTVVRRKRTSVRRRRNPVAANPRRRRKSPVRRRRTSVRRRRRNPARRITARTIQRQLTVATQGALGAIGLDIALAYIPLPAQLTGPFATPVIKGLAAVGLGAVAGMAGIRAETANRMTEGALTVQLHTIGKTMLAQFMPNIAMGEYLSGMGYYGSGYNPGQSVDDPDWNSGMGTYLTDISADDMDMDQGGFAMYENAGDEAFGW